MDVMLKALKIEYPWLKQAESTSLQRVNRDLDDAFQRFFNHSLQNGFPRLNQRKTLTKAILLNLSIIIFELWMNITLSYLN